MIDHNDPLVRLRAANPVAAPGADASWAPAARALLARIVSEAPVVAPPRRRRRWVVAPALAVATMAGAVASALLSGGVSKPENVACYERADLQSRTEAIGVDARGAAAACADLWAAGVFGDAAVPPLVECTLASGLVGVFPSTEGAQACARLGLPSPPPPPTAPPAPGNPPPTPPVDVNARFLLFRDAALSEFLASPCVEPATAESIVRRELDRAGLADWSVRPDQAFSPDRPCATLAFHPEQRQVGLVPGPPRR